MEIWWIDDFCNVIHCAFSCSAESKIHGAAYVRCCVRVIKSHRAGVGKTLKVKRLAEQLQLAASKTKHRGPLLVSIPLHCRNVDQSTVLQTLLQHTLTLEEYVPRIFHIDIAHEVPIPSLDWPISYSYCRI